MDQRQLLDELDAHYQIKSAMVRYVRGLDRCDRAMILSAFHPDGIDDHGSFRGSPEEFAGWAITLHRSMIATSHFLSNIHVERDGDTALCEADVLVNLRYEKEGEVYDLLAAGRYLDRWERRDRRWGIVLRRSIADWNRVDRVDAQFSGAVTDSLARGRQDGSDPSYAHFAGQSADA